MVQIQLEAFEMNLKIQQGLTRRWQKTVESSVTLIESYLKSCN